MREVRSDEGYIGRPAALIRGLAYREKLF